MFATERTFLESTAAAEWPMQEVPTYKLYDPASVGLATFLGSPLAGMTLMALNYRRLGQPGNAVMAMLCGVGITAIAAASGYYLPDGMTLPIGLGLIFGMRAAAQSLQGEAIGQHIERDGQIASRWAAFGIGMAFLLVLGGLIFAPLIAGEMRSHVEIGTKDEVYYTGSTTKAEAQAVGDGLKQAGLLRDQGANIFLDKGVHGTSLGIVLKDGAWEQSETVATLEQAVNRLAPAMGGYPVEMQLLDAKRDVHKRVEIGQAVFAGKDHVYYFGPATQSEAQALGERLQAEGYLDGDGSDVYLAKGDSGYDSSATVSFVVADGAWNNPRAVPLFRQLGRNIAPSVGGLPIRIRFLNDQLDSQKELTVQ